MMKTRTDDEILISALLDDEITAGMRLHALDQLGESAEAKRSWQAGYLLRDYLRESGGKAAQHESAADESLNIVLASNDFAESVATSLTLEPQVLAPNALPPAVEQASNVVDLSAARDARKRWQFAAMAASVMLVASWVFSPQLFNTGSSASQNIAKNELQVAPEDIRASSPALSASQAEELEALMVEHGEFTGLAALNGLVAYAKVVNQQVAGHE